MMTVLACGYARGQGERLGSLKEYMVRHAIDRVLLTVIGWVNRLVFWASRHQLVLYRFGGMPGVLLTVIGPGTPLGEIVMVGYLPDGDDYIVMACDTELGELAALRTATAATAEITHDQHVTVDITMLTDEAERAALLDRLLRRAPIYLRYEVMSRREFPIARLTLHGKPAADAHQVSSGIRLWTP
jgi:hypothetical protein